MSTGYRIVLDPPGLFLAGISQPNPAEIDWYLHRRNAVWQTDPPLEAQPADPEILIEAAGRVCYQSWRNPKGRRRPDYLQEAIIGHKHGSVLEHLWYNVLVCDLPRAIQLELVRHGEGTAFSFESQRFTDQDLRFVAPPLVRDTPDLLEVFRAECADAYVAYCTLLKLIDQRLFGLEDEPTLRRKRLKETARAMLPNCVAGDGMVSLNARAARHIIQSRSDEHADLAIREFAYELYHLLAQRTPAVFADATLVPARHWPPQVRFAAEKV